jgi:hypothetical protein
MSRKTRDLLFNEFGKLYLGISFAHLGPNFFFGKKSNVIACQSPILKFNSADGSLPSWPAARQYVATTEL